MLMARAEEGWMNLEDMTCEQLSDYVISKQWHGDPRKGAEQCKYIERLAHNRADSCESDDSLGRAQLRGLANAASKQHWYWLGFAHGARV